MTRSHYPHLNNVSTISASYSSPRGCMRSYNPGTMLLQYSNGSHGTYHRNGDSSRDNWIIGKGASEADGWDGWSLVQGEKRYWETHLQKVEHRGKCGGARGNLLSEEQIVRRMKKKKNQQEGYGEVKWGLHSLSDKKREKRQEDISKIVDALHKLHLPELEDSAKTARENAKMNEKKKDEDLKEMTIRHRNRRQIEASNKKIMYLSGVGFPPVSSRNKSL
eukprot:Tbor_TRINITY_DN5439_c1_g2::TRINITY_DN5439_c1_g2_i1::g.24358::m.24358